jgi:hypothetical protein
MIDITKKYKTRDGHAVILTRVDPKGGPYPIEGYIILPVGNCWTAEGRYYAADEEEETRLGYHRDLVEVNDNEQRRLALAELVEYDQEINL